MATMTKAAPPPISAAFGPLLAPGSLLQSGQQRDGVMAT